MFFCSDFTKSPLLSSKLIIQTMTWGESFLFLYTLYFILSLMLQTLSHCGKLSPNFRHEIYCLSNLNNNLIVSHESPLSFTLSTPKVIMEYLKLSSTVTFKTSKILCGFTKCLQYSQIHLSSCYIMIYFLFNHRYNYR
jgi:hypothetical protein